ncbi:MAG: alpha/beta hydrolase [Bacillota bacterium]
MKIKSKYLLIIIFFSVCLFAIYNLYFVNQSFTVENRQIINNGIIQNLKIYSPKDRGKYPAIVFGAGSGAQKALYNYFAKSFAKNGFVVLLRNTSYGHKKIKTWDDSKKDFINCIDYIKSLDNVDSKNILIGGHSANANIAYRVSLQKNDEIKGLIAIAGRFPPDNFKQKTNIFLSTGSNDKLVKPEKIFKIARKIKKENIVANKIIGDFNKRNALYLYIDKDSNHLTEIWSPNIIKRSIEFAFHSVNKDINTIKKVYKFNFFNELTKFVIGIFIFYLLLKINYLKKIYLERYYYRIFYLINIFLVLFLTFKKTISNNFIDLGPFYYNYKRHILVFFISTILLYIFKNITLFNKNLLKHDFLFVFTIFTIYILIMNIFIYIPIFNAGGSLIIFKTIILLFPLLIINIIFNKYKIKEKKEFSILYLVWILPLILPSSILI